MAITWQDLRSQDHIDPSMALTRAREAFNGGFNVFDEALKARQAQEAANWNQQKQNNTQAFLDEITKYRTADEFDAAQKNGVFAALRQQFGPQVDTATIRAAEDARLSALQDRDLKAGQFQDAQTDRLWRPVAERIKMLSATGEDGDLAQARFLTNTYQPYGLTHAGDLSAGITKAERDAADFAAKGEEHESRLATEKSQRASAEVSRRANENQIKLAQRQLAQLDEADAVKTALAHVENAARGKELGENGLPTAKLYETLADQLTGDPKVPMRVRAQVLAAARERDTATLNNALAYAKQNGMIGESIEPAVVSKVLTDELGSMVKNKQMSEDDAKMIMYSAGKLINEGLDIDGTRVYPSANLIRRVLPGAEGWTGWNWGIGGDARSRLEQLMRTPEYRQEYGSRLNAAERAKFLSAMPKPNQADLDRAKRLAPKSN